MLASSIVIVFSIALLGCSNGASMCGNDIKQTMLSPDGKLKAIVFARSCGATTGYTTQMSLIDAQESLGNQMANTFFLEEGDTKKVLLEWKANDKLVIHNKSTKYWIDERPNVPTKNGDVRISVSHQP